MSKIADAKARLEKSKFWQELSDEAKESLFEMLRELNPKSPEELDWMIFIGNCPNCGSENTKDCETVLDLENNTVGFCCDCGFLWCLECGSELTGKICAHWTVCNDCEERNEEGFCQYIEASECPSVREFMGGKKGEN